MMTTHDEARLPHRYTIQEKLKYYIRMAVGRIRPQKDDMEGPVFVLSTRRSGSTLLTSILEAVPGYEAVDEPFNLWRANPHRNGLPAPAGQSSKFLTRSDDEQDRLLQYIESLVNRDIVGITNWRLWNSRVSWRVSRRIFKVLNAKGLIDLFVEYPRSSVIFLIRHPVPRAMSAIRLNWGVTLSCWYETAWFRDAYLNNRVVSEIQRVAASGDELERHMMEWALENCHPVSFMRENGGNSPLFLTFEDVVLESEKVCRKICDHIQCDSSHVRQMLSQLRHPSETASAESKRIIEKSNQEGVVHNWMKHVSPERSVELCDWLCDLFPTLDIYTGNAATARKKYRIVSGKNG